MCFISSAPPTHPSSVDKLAAVQIWQGVPVYHKKKKKKHKWECLGASIKLLKLANAKRVGGLQAMHLYGKHEQMLIKQSQ